MEYAYPDLHTTLLTWWATVAPAARDYHIGITSGEIETTDPAFGYRLSTEPFQSPEWTNVELALRTYPDLRAQIESGVPYALGPMVVHTPTIGNAFIDTALTRFRTGKPLPIGVDLEWFNSVYLPIENYFSATSVIYRITVPLQGLICASAEIVLDESVRIVHLSHAELQDQERRKVHSVASEHGGSYPEGLQCALRCILPLPKLPGQSVEKVTQQQESWRSAALRALSVTVPNRVVSYGALIEPQGWAPSVSSSAQVPPVIFRRLETAPTLIKAEHEETLRKAWGKFADSEFTRRSNDLALAADRLTKADSERASADRLVDLVTAMEALLSQGEGALDELRYRLSIRAARYIAADAGQSQRAVFDLTRAALRNRNKILRSIALSERDHALPGITSFDMFVDRFEEIVRATLQKRLLTDGGVRVDWKTLLLNRPDEEIELENPLK
jgi:hypothetical protein